MYPLLLLHGTCRGHLVFFYVALAPLLLYLLDLFMRRFNISTTNIIKLNTNKDQGQEITKLVVECPLNFIYTPRQYVELNFLPISAREWHPFTIASVPNEKASGKMAKRKWYFTSRTWGDGRENSLSTHLPLIFRRPDNLRRFTFEAPTGHLPRTTSSTSISSSLGLVLVSRPCFPSGST